MIFVSQASVLFESQDSFFVVPKFVYFGFRHTYLLCVLHVLDLHIHTFLLTSASNLRQEIDTQKKKKIE